MVAFLPFLLKLENKLDTGISDYKSAVNWLKI